ncbi:MAG: WecB/TagA/CpsF family glycosyltransferase [bacterium]
MKIEILGVKINIIDFEEAIKKIEEFLLSDSSHQVATINPEFVLSAQKNNDFKTILNNADLATCDGAGLSWAGNFLYCAKMPRVTGVDLTEKLFVQPLSNSKIYLLGGDDEVAKAVKDKYLDAPIVGAENGGQIKTGSYLLENNKEVLSRINQSRANILLVAFGQIKQEMWIANNLKFLPNIRVAIGIGGTFDYLSGRVKRAPAWMRHLGLEWLFRLLHQPKRITRIFKATIFFVYKIVRERLKIKKTCHV